MQGRCGELERSRTPDDQELVEELIAKVFAKLPDDFAEEKTLRANGLCRVRCIEGLTEKKPEDLGIDMVDAVMILDVLQAGVEPLANSGPTGAAGESRAAIEPKAQLWRPEMRLFPKCGMTQYSDLEGWSVYKTGLGLCATQC